MMCAAKFAAPRGVIGQLVGKAKARGVSWRTDTEGKEISPAKGSLTPLEGHRGETVLHVALREEHRLSADVQHIIETADALAQADRSLLQVTDRSGGA